MTSEPEERSLEEKVQSDDVLQVNFHKCWFNHNTVPCCELKEMEFFPRIKTRNQTSLCMGNGLIEPQRED